MAIAWPVLYTPRPPASEVGRASLWDVPARKRKGPVAGHKGRVMDAAVTADGRLAVTGSLDGTVRLWDARSWSPLASHRWDVALADVATEGVDVRAELVRQRCRLNGRHGRPPGRKGRERAAQLPRRSGGPTGWGSI